MKIFNLYSRLQRFDTLDSTNNYASKLIREGQPEEGTVIMADFQTYGKGQRNNIWQSDKNSNIIISIILFPEFLPPDMQFYLSMSLSLGITEHLKNFNLHPRIKWPNDIYIGKKKIAGILIENAIMNHAIRNSVLGIGLNVNQKQFSTDLPNPTSMIAELKSECNIMEVLKSLLFSVEKWLTKLYNKEYNVIKISYEKNMLFRNEWVNFSQGKTIFSGKITGINEAGQLLITDEKKSVKVFDFKEVEYCL